MFKQICYVLKNKEGYYYGYNGELIFEDSSLAKRFYTLDDVRKINDYSNFMVLEVEFGFNVIREVHIGTTE